MTRKPSQTEIIKWYKENLVPHEQLREELVRLLRKALSGEHTYTITSRVKELDSFMEKASDKKYKNPYEDIKDVVGVRVITYLLQDIESVRQIIEKDFQIISEHSGDKSVNLAPNEVGYLSYHYVAQFTQERTRLPKYENFKGKCFEIQIRTILQHTWAAIEHGWRYKKGRKADKENSKKLSSQISRRISLLAGLLEIADKEFQSIAVAIKDAPNDDSPTDLSISSVNQFLVVQFQEQVNADLLELNIDESIVDELRKFGIKSANEIDHLFSISRSDEFIKDAFRQPIGAIGLLRDLMLIYNTKLYMEEVWRGRWSGISEDEVAFISRWGGGSSEFYNRGIVISLPDPDVDPDPDIDEEELEAEEAEKVQEMVDWFYDNYKDPADGVPYDGGEGGYFYYEGGPYNPYDQLSERFSEIDDALIKLAAERILSEGGHEWVKNSQY